MDKLKGESAKKLLVSMIRECNLTKEDQEDLKVLIEDLSREGD